MPTQQPAGTGRKSTGSEIARTIWTTATLSVAFFVAGLAWSWQAVYEGLTRCRAPDTLGGLIVGLACTACLVWRIVRRNDLAVERDEKLSDGAEDAKAMLEMLAERAHGKPPKEAAVRLLADALALKLKGGSRLVAWTTYGSVAACFLLAPSCLACFGFLLAPWQPVPGEHVREALRIGVIFGTWLLSIVVVDWARMHDERSMLRKCGRFSTALGLTVWIAFAATGSATANPKDPCAVIAVVAAAALGSLTSVHTLFRVILDGKRDQTSEPEASRHGGERSNVRAREN